MTDPLDSPSNHELIKEKIAIIQNSISKNEDPFKYQLNFSFHGIEISFHTESYQLWKNLKSYLPKNWLLSFKPKNKIFHHNVPASIKSIFDNEVSSLIKNIEKDSLKFSTQRDFTACLTQEHICHVMFEDMIDDGLHNFFRWYLSPKLIKYNKCMIHSSVVIDENSYAQVFLGPSGAGKTTITQLSRPKRVLSDDMNLFILDDNKIYARPGGVGGFYKPDVELDQKFTVKNIFWLKQSHQNYREEIPVITQHRHFLSSLANIPWKSLTSDKAEDYLRFCQKIVQITPLQNLYFSKDPDFFKNLS